MLSDLERKLLRILFNFSAQRRRMPLMPEVMRMTGRDREGIMIGLRGLVEQQYILWPDNPKLDTIVILEGWDRDSPAESNPKPSGSNIDYWTMY